MLKEGKWRALRNLPIGWLTHSVHGRDVTERYFHIAGETFLVMLIIILLRSLDICCDPGFLNFAGPILIAHSIMWVLDGNFHVYLLDSFKAVGNGGFPRVISYIEWSCGYLKKSGAVECILIYGSFCRGMFHGRSDLDLRVVRRKDVSSVTTLWLLSLAVYLRFRSLLKGVPTDLQVVDSFDFLSRQMRKDERPVVVFCRDNVVIPNRGISLREIVKDPSLALRKDVYYEST